MIILFLRSRRSISNFRDIYNLRDKGACFFVSEGLSLDNRREDVDGGIDR